jgi:hypothetical protein
MAMKRSFYTIDGVIVGEQTSSGRINYATDALGSVTGTLVGNQLVNTYAYKPYGALLASTGSGTAPKQQWVGNLGYRPTGRAQSDYYVRARHHGAVPGRWTTVDLLWPAEHPYTYALCMPTSRADATGMKVVPGGPVRAQAVGMCGKRKESDCDDLFKKLPKNVEEAIQECWREPNKKEFEKCVQDKLGGDLSNLFWAWLACEYGSFLLRRPGVDPCADPVDCVACCGGAYTACVARCHFEEHKAIPLALCLTWCYRKTLQCMADCDDGQSDDPWPWPVNGKKIED